MSQIPSRQEIIDFISSQPGKVGKREIARAFQITGSDRIPLKQLLRELAAEGVLTSDKLSGMRLAGDLPSVCMIKIISRDREGGFIAIPVAEASPDKPTDPATPDAQPPNIRILENKTHKRTAARSPRLAIGDRALARLSQSGDGYTARIIKKIEEEGGRIIGRVQSMPHGLMLIAADRRERYDFKLRPDTPESVQDGDLIIAEKIGRPREREKSVKWIETIGSIHDVNAFSLLSIAEQGIPIEFPEDLLKQAMAQKPLNADEISKRTDLRHLDFITIDPADARDHDDAVFAEVNPKGGYIVWVAIADVAHYVRPGSAMDIEARKRGNSVYMPDRVIPMLPEHLSNDLCSLRVDQERPCLVVSMEIDADGYKRNHSFFRAIIRIGGKYSYQQAQAQFDAIDAAKANNTSPNKDELALKTVWQAYQAMAKARDQRGPLELNRPERKVRLSEDGKVAEIASPPRLEAHRLVEEMMVTANSCAAETLLQARSKAIFRIHDGPSQDRVRGLAGFVRPLGIRIDLGQPMLPRLFNHMLQDAEGEDHSEMVSEAVLRAQSQAIYSCDNIGHFGLNLARYAHFTSPIRRYADLIIHRALIRSLTFGEDGLVDQEITDMEETADLISKTERRAMLAERGAMERYLSAFMSDRVGETFDAQVSGISRAGLFVRLKETGAEGLIPVSRLGAERFYADEDGFELKGSTTGLTYRLGQAIEVKLVETTPVKGGLLFTLAEDTSTYFGPRRSGKIKRSFRNKTGAKQGAKQAVNAGSRKGLAKKTSSRKIAKKTKARGNKK